MKKTAPMLPKHASAEFIPPPDLSDEEKAVWHEITDILRDIKSSKMSDADYELLRQYCQLTVTRNKAWKEYIQKPERYTRIVTGICSDGKTPKIVLKDNEHYKTWLECNKNLDTLLKEMEINPKSRQVSRESAAKNAILAVNGGRHEP
jgi:phage terminase small subunit